MMKLLLGIVLFLFLSPWVNSQSLELPDSLDKLSQSELRTVSKKDFYLSATGPLVFPGIKLLAESFILDPRVDFRFSHMRFGTFDFNYAYSIFLTEFGNAPEAFSNQVDKNNFNFSYAIPIRSKFKLEPLSDNLTLTNKKGIVQSKTLRRLSIQSGFQKSYSINLTNGLGKDLLEDYYQQTGQEYFTTDGWIGQSVSKVNLGLLYERVINTNFGKKSNVGTGSKLRRSTVFSIYSNVQYGLKSDLSPVSQVSFHTGVVTANADISEVSTSGLDFKRIGFAGGVNYTHFNSKGKPFSSRLGLEFGASPGYNDNIINGAYFSVKFVRIGFGFMSKGSRNREEEPQEKSASVEVVSSITHATCSDETGDVTFSIAISGNSSNGAQTNSLILTNEIGDVVYIHPNTQIYGSISNLPVGMYTFSGSVTVIDSTGLPNSYQVNSTIWIGVETVWDEKIDMVESPNSFSAKRDASTVSYGGALSSNRINSGDGWVQMSAVYGSVVSSHIYWLIGETNSLGGFSPNDSIQYIEFFKSAGANGIIVKYETGGSYATTFLSLNPNDTIRLIRTGSTLSIQKNNSSTNIFSLPTQYSGAMNIVVRSLTENDGCLNVVSSFKCRSKMYAKVERKLQGVKYKATGNSLKFYVTEEYDNQAVNLNYMVYANGDRLNPVLTGIQQVQPVVYGDNRYNLNIENLSAGVYILEVENDKKEKFYLRFIKE